jgi:hypothetical protein
VGLKELDDRTAPGSVSSAEAWRDALMGMESLPVAEPPTPRAANRSEQAADQLGVAG